MRSSMWIVGMGLGALALGSLGASSTEQSSWRDSADCRAAARAFSSGNPADLIEFRDTFRPDSEEAGTRKYELIAWSGKERELVRGRLLRSVGKQAPGLLQRAAADGALSLYRVKQRGLRQATGGYRRMTFSRAAFPRPGYDWLTRIIAHELVHSSDPYNKLSTDPAWNMLIEPRITALRALLAKEGLTVVKAASMPLSDRRTKLEQKIRKATGLPSAYAGHSTEEAIAEIVSFMIDKSQGYQPPPQMTAFLQKRLLCTATIEKDQSASAHREGIRLAAAGRASAAVEAFTEAIRLDPRFVRAYMELAESQPKRNTAARILSLSEAVPLTPRYSRLRPYLLTSRGLLRLGDDLSGAAADCAAALSLRANYYNALFLCGRVKLAKLDFDGAITDFEAAIKVLPNYKSHTKPWLEKARSGQKKAKRP